MREINMSTKKIVQNNYLNPQKHKKTPFKS